MVFLENVGKAVESTEFPVSALRRVVRIVPTSLI